MRKSFVVVGMILMSLSVLTLSGCIFGGKKSEDAEIEKNMEMQMKQWEGAMKADYSSRR